MDVSSLSGAVCWPVSICGRKGGWQAGHKPTSSQEICTGHRQTVCRARTYNHKGYKARQGFTIVTGMQILSLQSLLRGQRQGKPVE